MLSRKNWEKYLKLEVNPIIRLLILSDFAIFYGFGLINPIFAVFLNNQIRGGNLEVIGFASTIYLVTKSLGQIPVAEVVDRLKGEEDDFWLMVIGTFAFSLVPILYLFARTPLHIYLIQFFNGVMTAFTFPSWMAIFTRHIDKNMEGLEWGIYYTLTDLGGAAAAGLGGFLAQNYGFQNVFVLTAIFSLVGSFFLLLTKKYLFIDKF